MGNMRKVFEIWKDGLQGLTLMFKQCPQKKNQRHWRKRKAKRFRLNEATEC